MKKNPTLMAEFQMKYSNQHGETMTMKVDTKGKIHIHHVDIHPKDTFEPINKVMGYILSQDELLAIGAYSFIVSENLKAIKAMAKFYKEKAEA